MFVRPFVYKVREDNLLKGCKPSENHTKRSNKLDLSLKTARPCSKYRSSLAVTIGYLKATVVHLRVTISHLKDGEGHFKLTMITIGHPFSFL